MLQAFSDQHNDRAHLRGLINDGRDWDDYADVVYGLSSELCVILTVLGQHAEPLEAVAEHQMALLQYLRDGADTTNVGLAYLYECLCHFQERLLAYHEKIANSTYWDAADVVLSENLIRVCLGEERMSASLWAQAEQLVKTAPFLLAVADALMVPGRHKYQLALLAFITHPLTSDGKTHVDLMPKWLQNILENCPPADIPVVVDSFVASPRRRLLQLQHRKKLPSNP